MTSAAMASTTTIARGTTQTSCLPFPFSTIFSPCRFTVSWSFIRDATGLKATRKKISFPLEMPPWIPPERFVSVMMDWFRAMKRSLCSDPYIPAAEKPEPYSKPLTALMLKIAFPSSACNLSKTGSPNPAGTPFILQETG